MTRVARGVVLGLLGGLLAAGCPVGGAAEAGSTDLFEQLSESHYIRHGDSDYKVYAFKDPNCPHCTDLTEAVEGGATPSVEWRWVPVAFLGEESLADAAATIEEAHDVDGRSAVRANMTLARELGVRSVPTVFYRDASGEIRSFVGGGEQALDALERLATQ